MMGREYRCGAKLRQHLPKVLQKTLSRRWIEGREWLVEKEDLGIEHQGPRLAVGSWSGSR